MQAVKTAKHQWEEAFKESEIDRKNLEREIELHRSIIHQLQAENEELREAKPMLPEPADLLNQLKAKRKKSKAELGDVEAIVEIIEGE